MANVNAVSLTAPSDYGAELKALERRRKLAEALQAQSAQPLETNQMAGGYVIPVSPLAGAAKMLQAYAGHKMTEKADEEERGVSRRYNEDLVRVLNEGNRLSAGSPERPSLMDPQELEQSADQGTPLPPPIPAQAPNPMAAASMYMTHPETRQLGRDEMRRQRMIEAMGLGTSQAAGGAPAGQPSPSGAAPSPGGAPGAVNGIPRNVAMALLLADPDGKLLAQKMAESSMQQSKPTTKMQEAAALGLKPGTPEYNAFIGTQYNQGGAWQVSPQGGVGLAPGYAQGMGQVKRAEEGAKAEFDIVQVPQSDGSTVSMPRSQAVQRMGQPQQSAPIPQSELTGRPQPEIDAIRRVQAAEGRGEPYSETVPPRPLPAPVLGTSQTPAAKVGSEAQARADVERGQARPQATAAFNDAISNMDRLAAEASAVMKSGGMGGITGIRGAIPDVPGSAAANSRARLEALKSQVAFAALQAMRDASKTGGALGQVTERELAMLQNNIAALSTAQSEDALKASLNQIITFTQGAKQRMTQAYSSQYGTPQGGGMPTGNDPLGLFPNKR